MYLDYKHAAIIPSEMTVCLEKVPNLISLPVSPTSNLDCT